MHFFQVGVSVKGRVAAEQEIGYYAYSPDIDWFSMAGLLENFRGHVAWCTTCSGQNVELFLVHYSGETEIGNEEVGIVFWGAEEEVLGFEITVHNAMVVQVGYGGEGGTN